MATRVLLAPAAGGKTQACIDLVREVLRGDPLAAVWIVVPDRHQGWAIRRRLAERGGVLGARAGTFGDLYGELLALVGLPVAVAPEPVVHRLMRAAIDSLAERGALQHYLPIQWRPGFVRISCDLIAELKRNRIQPERFAEAVSGRGPRLEELAELYAEYQAMLTRIGWADPEGLGWLAVEALQRDRTLAAGWRLLVVDGFDSFNPTQLTAIRLLADRIDETLITLAGQPDMPRLAHRRFARTLEMLRDELPCCVETLDRVPGPSSPLAHLESSLFTQHPQRQPAGDAVVFIEAQNMALEAREALRWLKARIVRDGLRPEDCAVIARDIEPYRMFLRQVAREYSLPLRFASGEPLASNPAVAAVLTLLELKLQEWSRRPVLDVLRSPYFDLSSFDLSVGDVSALSEAALQGLVIKGKDQWREALSYESGGGEPVPVEDDETRPPRRPSGETARRLWQKLSAFFERVEPVGQDTVTSYVRWVEDLISDQGGLRFEAKITAQPDTAERDKAALEAFRDVLRALVLSETILGQPAEVRYRDFYLELSGIVNSASYRVDGAGDGHVYVASLNAARGVSYRAVAVLGLSEGLFPAPLGQDPVLSDEEREELRAGSPSLGIAGLPLEPRIRSDQQTLCYEGLTRARQYLLLSRPYLTDDGERWEPSPYWVAALELFDAQPRRVRPEDTRGNADAASAIELLTWCVRAGVLPGRYRELLPQWEALRHGGSVLRQRLANRGEGEHEGELSRLEPELATRYGPDHLWSASRLESYGSCGFQFFVGSALALEPREPPQPGFDAAQLGSMLHKILELVYREAADPTDEECLLAALPSVAQRVFEQAPQTYGFRPTPLWEVERGQLVEMLKATITSLCGVRGDFRPARFEADFGFGKTEPLVVETELGPILFRGVIDRVDVDRGGRIQVIDYKTGTSGLTPRDLVEGRRLQLALYAVAAERALGLGRTVDGFYWGIRSGQPSALSLATFSCVPDDGPAYFGVDGAVELARQHVAAHVRGIRSGKFTPIPPPGGCHDYCPAQSFCWRYVPTSKK